MVAIFLRHRQYASPDSVEHANTASIEATIKTVYIILLHASLIESYPIDFEASQRLHNPWLHRNGHLVGQLPACELVPVSHLFFMFLLKLELECFIKPLLDLFVAHCRQ